MKKYQKEFLFDGMSLINGKYEEEGKFSALVTLFTLTRSNHG